MIKAIKTNHNDIQKIILLNLKSKAILEEERGFINSIEQNLSEIAGQRFIIMPVIPFPFFYMKGAKRDTEQVMPSNWENIVKHIMIYNEHETYVAEAFLECVNMCKTKFFRVDGDAGNKGDFGITVENADLLSYILKKNLVPVVFFKIEDGVDVNKITKNIITILKLTPFLEGEQYSAILVLNFLEGDVQAITGAVLQGLKEQSIKRGSYKLVLGGDPINYVSVAKNNLMLFDGISLDVFEGNEQKAGNKLKKIFIL